MSFFKIKRCPYRRQNEDYANYLLTTLFYESKVIIIIFINILRILILKSIWYKKNFEEWEKEINEDDRVQFIWEETKSKTNIEELSKRSIQPLQPEALKNYGERLEKVFDQGESQANLDGYKAAVMNILKVKNKTDSKVY